MNLFQADVVTAEFASFYIPQAEVLCELRQRVDRQPAFHTIEGQQNRKTTFYLGHRKFEPLLQMK